MKRTVYWIVVLALMLGTDAWSWAQQPGLMQGGHGRMGRSMMAREASPAQAAGKAASDYSRLCASCHGATGKGDGPAAAALHPKPNDFADCKRMAKVSDEKLFDAIKSGGPSVGLSPLMPAWDRSLTERQMHDLVGYIREFCKK